MIDIKIISSLPIELDDESFPIFGGNTYADFLRKWEKRKVMWFSASENGSMIYLLPFSIIKKPLLKIGEFLTATIQLQEQTETSEKDFLNAVLQKIKSEKLCDWIKPPPLWAIFQEYPDQTLQAPFGSYIVDLRKEEEDIFKNFDKKCRTRVRKGEKMGVEVLKGKEHLEEIYKLIKSTAEVANQYVEPFDYYEELAERFPNNMLYYLAVKDGEPQVGKIRIFNRYCAYGIGNGRIARPEKGAGNFIVWEEFKDMKAHGVERFDFVGARLNPPKGSKLEGIQKFKASFGSELKEGFIWKAAVNPLKAKAYDAYLKLRYKSMGMEFKGDVIDQERKRLEID